MKGIEKLIVFAAFSAVAIPAQAVVAYSNFGAGDSYNASTGWVVSTAPQSVVQTPVMQFTSGATGIVDKIRVAMQGLDAGAVYNAVLYSDSGANTIGTNMVAWGFTTPAGASIITLTNLFPTVTLTAGNKYWLEVRGVDPDIYEGWCFSNSTFGRAAFSFDGNLTYSYFNNLEQSAFDITVQGTNVPEPFTMALMGGAALAGYRRMRRKSA